MAAPMSCLPIEALGRGGRTVAAGSDVSVARSQSSHCSSFQSSASSGGCGADDGSVIGLFGARSEHLAAGEDLSDLGLEVLERQRVVVGIEAGLVPLVSELLGQRERLGVERLAVLLA